MLECLYTKQFRTLILVCTDA